jgi:hypothetical protein
MDKKLFYTHLEKPLQKGQNLGADSYQKHVEKLIDQYGDKTIDQLTFENEVTLALNTMTTFYPDFFIRGFGLSLSEVDSELEAMRENKRVEVEYKIQYALLYDVMLDQAKKIIFDQVVGFFNSSEIATAYILAHELDFLQDAQKMIDDKTLRDSLAHFCKENKIKYHFIGIENRSVNTKDNGKVNVCFWVIKSTKSIRVYKKCTKGSRSYHRLQNLIECRKRIVNTQNLSSQKSKKIYSDAKDCRIIWNIQKHDDPKKYGFSKPNSEKNKEKSSIIKQAQAHKLDQLLDVSIPDQPAFFPNMCFSLGVYTVTENIGLTLYNSPKNTQPVFIGDQFELEKVRTDNINLAIKTGNSAKEAKEKPRVYIEIETGKEYEDFETVLQISRKKGYTKID